VKNVLIVGATSAIAVACARQWTRQDARLFLVGRNYEKLEAVAGDLVVRGASDIFMFKMDVNDISSHPGMLEAATRALVTVDVALIACGTLPNQVACEQDATLTLQEFMTNGASVIALLTLLANHFEQQGRGAIAVITSVAGDRGRPSNYVYGGAKAAVSVFCDGMRARLFRAGASLTDIRPGFVATPMTRDLALPKLLVAQPEPVAKRILTGIERRADVLYVPAFWGLVMTAIRHIPNALFKRMQL
jgi:short-subunit dehydrogenase